jgi:hypothetical protein
MKQSGEQQSNLISVYYRRAFGKAKMMEVNEGLETQ